MNFYSARGGNVRLLYRAFDITKFSTKNACATYVTARPKEIFLSKIWKDASGMVKSSIRSACASRVHALQKIKFTFVTYPFFLTNNNTLHT